MAGLLFALAGAVPGLAQTAPVHGADAMDGKDRGGPDGWVQAPIPRVDAASGKAPGEANPDRSADSRARPVPGMAGPLPPGQDPGTPLPAPRSGVTAGQAGPSRN